MVGPSIMDSLFQRTLEDQIKGLRLNPLTESTFISKTLEEIHREIKSTDLDTKSTALQKLTYLHSIHGIDMSWAAFNVVEVLSSPRFSHKKIGYLAASLSFNTSTEVILLMTNQFRKDLTSTNQFEVGLALEFLSNGSNADLSRDLTPEIFTLLSSNKISVRKKAIVVLLRFFAQYPDSVRLCFKRLVENLDHSDPSVVFVTVGVFCELIQKDNPASYLPLAPEFYTILVNSKNNWVLIKAVKIFSRLIPLEPRLGKKVMETICDLVQRTMAKSLLFECVQMIATCLNEFDSAVKLVVGKIKELLVDDDSNLRYLGLKALARVADNHTWAIMENKEAVIKSLSDDDPNIKGEALYLVMSMVIESNVVEISRVLISYAVKSDPGFCNEIVSCLLSTCSRNFYEVVVDFDWYVSFLYEMARIPNFKRGEEVGTQIIDVSMRVSDVRPQLVRVCRDLLIDPALLGNPSLHIVLSASALVLGEYVEFSKNPIELMNALVQPRTSLLPAYIRVVYIHSLFKVLLFCLHCYVYQNEVDIKLKMASVTLNEAQTDSLENGGCNLIPSPSGSMPTSSPSNGFCSSDIVNMVNLVEEALLPLLESHDMEVLERARNVLGFIELLKETTPRFFTSTCGDDERDELRRSKIIELAYDAFSNELGPISIAAQERVLPPEGLSLCDDLHELDVICKDLEFSPSSSLDATNPLSSPESASLLEQHRKRYQLYYLSSDKNDDCRPMSDLDLGDDSKNLAGLGQHLLVSKSKPHRSKPRPTVVKLDEVDAVRVAGKEPGLVDSDLSGAVRDALKERESMNVPHASSLKKSSRKDKGKDKVGVNVSPSNQSTRRSKDLETRTKEASGGGRKSSKLHKHGRRKTVDNVEPSASASMATVQIPDLLL